MEEALIQIDQTVKFYIVELPAIMALSRVIEGLNKKTEDKIEEEFAKLKAQAKSLKAELSYPPFLIYPDDNDKEKPIRACLPIRKEIKGCGETELIEIESCTACTSVHRGDYSKILDSVNENIRWLEMNGYRKCGPHRESFILMSHEVPDPRRTRFEIQIPVC